MEQSGQRSLQECWGSERRLRTLISVTMSSKLSGDGGLELRDVVKPLVFFSRRFTLPVDAMVRRLVLLFLCRLWFTDKSADCVVLLFHSRGLSTLFSETLLFFYLFCRSVTHRSLGSSRIVDVITLICFSFIFVYLPRRWYLLCNLEVVNVSGTQRHRGPPRVCGEGLLRIRKHKEVFWLTFHPEITEKA